MKRSDIIILWAAMFGFMGLSSSLRADNVWIGKTEGSLEDNDFKTLSNWQNGSFDAEAPTYFLWGCSKMVYLSSMSSLNGWIMRRDFGLDIEAPIVFRGNGADTGLQQNGTSGCSVGSGTPGAVRFENGAFSFSNNLNIGDGYNAEADKPIIGRVEVGADATVSAADWTLLNYGVLEVESDGMFRSSWIGGGGTINVSGGLLIADNHIYVGQNGYADAGKLNISSGSVSAAYIALATYGSTGTVNLDGGTLETKRVWHEGEGTPVLNLNGGTLKAAAGCDPDFVQANIAVNIGEGGAVIDSNGQNIYMRGSIDGMEGDGGLAKHGEGTLTITQGMKWTGPTKVYAGTLDMNGSALRGEVYVAPGARLVNAVLDHSASFETDEISLVREGGSYANYAVEALSVSGAKKILNSVNGLVGAAAVRYDPSDIDSMMIDAETKNVSSIQNKGYLGTLMDATAVGGSRGMPFVSDAFKTNGLVRLAFTNNYGFAANNKLTFAENQARAAFAVSARQRLDESMGADVAARMYSLYMQYGDWMFSIFQGSVNDYDSLAWFTAANAGLSEQKYIYFGESNNEGLFAMRYMNVHATGANAAVKYKRTGAGDFSSYVPDPISFDSLPASPGAMTLYYGENPNHDQGMTGLLGEMLLYLDELSDDDADVVGKYLANKWLGANEAIATNATTIAALALEDKAEVDFDGADVSLGDVTGSGTLKNGNFTINGTITISVDDNGEIEPIVVNGNVTFGANAALNVVGATNLPKTDVAFLVVTGDGHSISGRLSSVTTDDGKDASMSKSEAMYKIRKGRRGLIVIFR